MRGGKSHRPRFGRAVLIALALLLAVAGSSRAQDAAFYEFEVTLAPHCLDGVFPVTLDTAEGRVAGTAALTTDARGRLLGTLSLGGSEFAVTGKVKFRATVSKVTLAAMSGKDRINFKGELTGDAFAGTTKGKGSVAGGKGTFSLDLSGADPSLASFAISVATSPRGKLSGTGTVTVKSKPEKQQKQIDKILSKLGAKWDKILAGQGK